MARPRLQKHKDMPDNCYPLRVGRTTYYRYRHPHTGKFSSLGKDRSAALRAARVLNARLLSAPSVEELVAKVVAPRTAVSEYITRYRDVLLASRRSKRGKPLSDGTLAQYKGKLARLDEQLGAADLARVSRRDITVFLDQFPPVTRNNYRSLLRDFFAHAVAEGHRDDNPVEGTLKSDAVVKRRRLTIEEFNTLRAAAAPWFQFALDIALMTLQRREDISKLRTSDLKDGCLWVEQGKTGAHIRIKYAGTSLEPLLLPYAADDGESGWLVRLPTRRRYRAHLTKPSVTPHRLSTEFARLWTRVIGPRDETSPTFHEIRALGARMLKDRGIDPQPLLGHLDPRTTRTYLDRHQVQWIDAEIGV